VRPVPATDEQVEQWAAVDGCHSTRLVIGGPEEGDDVAPCPALVNVEANQVHVAFELDEIELAALAQGGTLWLTTWGMIPVHRLEVKTPR